MKSECLDANILAGYIDKRLLPEEKADVEKHLVLCDKCVSDLAMAGKIVMGANESVEHEAGPIERVIDTLQKIKDKFFEWTTELSPPAWVPQTRFLQTRTLSTLIKDTSNLQTEVYAEKDEDERVRIWIKVFRNDRSKNITLFLTKKGGSPCARILNGDCVLFDKQPFGTYTLIIEDDSHKLESCLIEIDETGIIHERIQNHLS
ncbi:MAG: hypothetical protein GY749_38405 [Desulfobacteraceae bacterium]|nr:hypothetical protein [Desulfobacteraceae bacterium]